MSRHRHSALLASRAKQLRLNQTDTERKLWGILRSRTLEGYKFRRQYIIEPYIVDFCCVDRKLVVELDGGQHADRREYDERRTAFLEAEGYQVVRFWDNEVLKEQEVVLNMILDILEARSIKTPPLLLRRKRMRSVDEE